MFAGLGYLAHLHRLGFQTFDSIIDESYDQITNPRQRLQAVIAEMSRISSLPAAAKAELFLKLHNIADRNRQHFFNKLFDQDRTRLHFLVFNTTAHAG